MPDGVADGELETLVDFDVGVLDGGLDVGTELGGGGGGGGEALP